MGKSPKVGAKKGSMMVVQSEEGKRKEEGLYTAGKCGLVCTRSRPFSVGRLTNRPRSNMSPDSCGLVQERLACRIMTGQGREEAGSLFSAPEM